MVAKTLKHYLWFIYYYLNKLVGGVENSEQFGYIKLKISHNIVSELRKDG